MIAHYRIDPEVSLSKAENRARTSGSSVPSVRKPETFIEIEKPLKFEDLDNVYLVSHILRDTLIRRAVQLVDERIADEEHRGTFLSAEQEIVLYLSVCARFSDERILRCIGQSRRLSGRALVGNVDEVREIRVQAWREFYDVYLEAIRDWADWGDSAYCVDSAALLDVGLEIEMVLDRLGKYFEDTGNEFFDDYLDEFACQHPEMFLIVKHYFDQKIGRRLRQINRAYKPIPRIAEETKYARTHIRLQFKEGEVLAFECDGAWYGDSVSMAGYESRQFTRRGHKIGAPKGKRT